MEKSKLLDYIEDKDISYVNSDWFYHASIYEREKYKSILTNGILSNVARGGLLKCKNGGWNGRFYVSVMKRNAYNTILESAWYNVLYTSPKFIVSDKVKAIKTNTPYLNFYTFSSSIFPIRSSYYKDEYQVFYKINSKDIYGIVYNLSYMLDTYLENEEYFNVLFSLVELLDEINLDLPIYDYISRKEINKNKCLKLKNV